KRYFAALASCSVIIGVPLVRHIRDGPQDKVRKLQTQRLLQDKHIYSLVETDLELQSLRNKTLDWEK
ncbi:uncharacterized, partial [Tachysurus ichikawai]